MKETGKMKVVLTAVLFSFLLPQVVFSADPALNKDQFKAPSVSDASKIAPKPGAAVPAPGAPAKLAGIQGLQSDAELQAWQSAPERVPATPQGSDKFTCPRGYFCEAYMSRTPPSTCVKDSFLFSTHEGGYCSKSLDGMWYGGRDKAERVA